MKREVNARKGGRGWEGNFRTNVENVSNGGRLNEKSLAIAVFMPSAQF